MGDLHLAGHSGDEPRLSARARESSAGRSAARAIERSSIYLGKLIANLVFVATIEVISVPLFSLFFNVPVLPYLLPLHRAGSRLRRVGFRRRRHVVQRHDRATRFAELPAGPCCCCRS